jgi:hypothetical protein
MAVRTDPDGVCPLCKAPYDDHGDWKNWPKLKCKENK